MFAIKRTIVDPNTPTEASTPQPEFWPMITGLLNSNIIRLSISLNAARVFLEFFCFEQKNFKNTRAAFREMDSLNIILQ
jgi:hypothetical protein